MSKNNYLDTSSYFRIIDNPDVNDFLSECDYLHLIKSHESCKCFLISMTHFARDTEKIKTGLD